MQFVEGAGYCLVGSCQSLKSFLESGAPQLKQISFHLLVHLDKLRMLII